MLGLSEKIIILCSLIDAFFAPLLTFVTIESLKSDLDPENVRLGDCQRSCFPALFGVSCFYLSFDAIDQRLWYLLQHYRLRQSWLRPSVRKYLRVPQVPYIRRHPTTFLSNLDPETSASLYDLFPCCYSHSPKLTLQPTNFDSPSKQKHSDVT